MPKGPAKQYGKAIEDMSNWIREGKPKSRETVVHGIENVPDALVSLFKTDNVGKMLVKVRRGTSLWQPSSGVAF
ncbi:hypothetical protein BG005_011332 [Podila minutissima]|nr:hypothetical protein BG005_011332 [Podila minutissima]